MTLKSFFNCILDLSMISYVDYSSKLTLFNIVVISSMKKFNFKLLIFAIIIVSPVNGFAHTNSDSSSVKLDLPSNPDKSTNKVEPNGVAFYGDIEPILQDHCQTCHNPLGLAPFSLVTYEDAKNWAAQIKQATSTKKMPPWGITGGLPMNDDKRLSSQDISMIANWADNDCPQGDLKNARKPIEFKSVDTWDDENPPDMVIQIPGTFHLAAKGDDLYRSFVIPINNPEGLNLRKSQIIPGNSKIIHHALGFYDGSGLSLDAQARLGNVEPKGLDDQDYGSGYSSGMGLGYVPNPANIKKNKSTASGMIMGWVPGAQKTISYPQGVVRAIPANSDLLLQVHYVRTGQPETDNGTRAGIWLLKDKPQRYGHGFLLDTDFIMIPKNVADFRSSGSREILEDSELYLMSPHMHRLGKEMRIWYQPKGSGARQLLLELKNWDFNWQLRYHPKEPFFLKKGSSLFVETIHDNSADNPKNLFNPPRDIFLGEETKDEMGFAIISVIQAKKPVTNIATSGFVKYLTKLMEAKAYKKLKGVFDEGN